MREARLEQGSRLALRRTPPSAATSRNEQPAAKTYDAANGAESRYLRGAESTPGSAQTVAVGQQTAHEAEHATEGTWRTPG
jgi:hypothetical protein